VLIQSLSTLSAIPLPLVNVYNWGKVMLLFTMQVIDLNTVNHMNLCPSVPKGIRNSFNFE
jgi:hypothetical protein